MPNFTPNEPKTPITEWALAHKDMNAEGLKKSFHANLQYRLGKDLFTTTKHDCYMAFAIAIRDRLVERWIGTQQSYHKENKKRVYYMSLEFLMGRLMGNNILNLSLDEEVKKAAADLGIDLEEMHDEESDAGLGNGGLGRLAACFLDSMATLKIPATGYGIRYDYGIFHQRIVNGYQVETPDEWLKFGNPWEFERPEYTVKVDFYGHVQSHRDHSGRLQFEWIGSKHVMAVPYDLPVPGYKNDVVNGLRLWSAKSSEDFDFEYFNDGDYEKAVYDKMYSENISKVLYPNDANAMGRELRLKQEYFFTAASIADILRRFKIDNQDLRDLPNKVAIQLNDTHPALAVVEFMRLLLDKEGLSWPEAWDITVKTFAYTNHTILPEALETWNVSLFEALLPRHMQIVYEINARFLEEVALKFPGDGARVKRMSLIEESGEKRVRMAYLAIVASHSTNGVSALHSRLITEQLFSDFYAMYPERFNNKTNGITPRRWLIKSNPALTGLISEAIGEEWKTNLWELEKLKGLAEDEGFREKWRGVKRQSKQVLADVIRKQSGVEVNLDSIFDVQIKRIHEYKRQTLFAFYMISEYLKLKNNPNADVTPRTFIAAGKAAPGYAMAKLMIKFMNAVGDTINRDPAIKNKLKVVFLENYRVSLAEKIFPASDLSEQISTAGKEASGTGCMKFMMNGALTVGTLDGANIEMAEAGGIENFYIFGLRENEVLDLKAKGYNPKDSIQKSERLQGVLRLIESNMFSMYEPGIFGPLLQNITNEDPYLVCADFESYCDIQDRISQDFKNQSEWTKKSILNVASSGKFSSDRTILEYARDIWGVA